MTRQVLSMTAITMVVVGMVLVAPAAAQCLANPDFGNPEFVLRLQQELGMVGAYSPASCPAVRGVPMPDSWGPTWSLRDPWVAYVNRYGQPPRFNRQDFVETPDQKWAKTVQRYQAFLMSHPYDGSCQWHQQHRDILEYLEQNYYNYWFRLRYGQNPPNHTSHYHGWGYGREGW